MPQSQSQPQDFATIPDIIRRQVGAHPDQAAIIESPGGRHRQVTFRELDAMSDNFAQRLLAAGVRPGDSVLVFVPMSISLYGWLLGIFRMGATAMFLDPSAGLAHLSACCAIRPPRAFLGTWKAHLLRLVSPALRSIPHHFWSTIVTLDPLRGILGAATSGSKSGPSLPFDPETPALITFTSGSTGTPKAVVRTHRFLIAQHQALEEAIELRPGQRDLVTLPVFVLANLASGVTSILPDSDMARPGMVDPRRIAVQVQRYQPDRTCGSPAFYARLLGAPPALGLFETFRSIYTGGAPVFPSLLQRMQESAPRARIVSVYGSSEAEPIAHLPWSEVTPTDLEHMRSGNGLVTGPPVPQTTLKILRRIPLPPPTPLPLPGAATGPIPISAEDFQREEAASHEPGEILVSGDHVLKGYLNGSGDSDTKCIVNGVIWHRTGDSGYLDTQGRLWLLGRSSAKVTDTRGTLYPFAVECVAQTYPFIERSAFLGHNGRRLLAVQFKPAPTSSASTTLKESHAKDTEALRQSLSWAHIDEIIPLPAIPVDKRHNAKVDYPALYKLLAIQRQVVNGFSH